MRKKIIILYSFSLLCLIFALFLCFRVYKIRKPYPTIKVNTSHGEMIIDNHRIYCAKISDKPIINLAEPVYLATSGDVTSHPGEELILAIGDSGRDKKKYFVCVAIEEGKGKVVAKSPADIYNPWKFIIADTNLDGKLDLACGVKKEAPLHPVFCKRMFFFGIDEEKQKFYPIFLFSRLSSRLEDFTFADVNGDGKDEVIALLWKTAQERCILCYRWIGNGLEVISESLDIHGNKIDADKDNIILEYESIPKEEFFRLLKLIP